MRIGLLGFLLPASVGALQAESNQVKTSPATRCAANGLQAIEVSARGENAVHVISRILEGSGARLHVVSGEKTLATVTRCAATTEDAIAGVVRSCGLAYRLIDGTYHVGWESDLIAELASPDDRAPIDTYYRCRHLDAVTLVDRLRSLFPELKIIAGPQFTSPSVKYVSGREALGSTVDIGEQGVVFRTHDVIISGPTNVVRRALLLTRKLDRPRKQVRLNVQITDVNSRALLDLGILWGQTGGLVATTTFSEESKRGESTDLSRESLTMNIGQFARSPISIAARLYALEEKNQARLLTNTHLVVLDGERSFVLTGTKYVYPKLASYTSGSGIPIFDITEVKVGVFLQVAVQVGLDGDIIMTLYPQVSNVTTFETINGAPYPVIATREQQTTVTVQSGETLAIGGLKREDTFGGRSQVPILGAIPLIGELFKVRQSDKTQSELVVLITPELVQ